MSSNTLPASRALIRPESSYAYFPGRYSSETASSSPGRTTEFFFVPRLLSPRNQSHGQFDPFWPLQELANLPPLEESDERIGLRYGEHRSVEGESVDGDPRTRRLDERVDVSERGEPFRGDISHRELDHSSPMHFKSLHNPVRPAEHLLPLLQACYDAEDIRVHRLVHREDRALPPLLCRLLHVDHILEVGVKHVGRLTGRKSQPYRVKLALSQETEGIHLVPDGIGGGEVAPEYLAVEQQVVLLPQEYLKPGSLEPHLRGFQLLQVLAERYKSDLLESPELRDRLLDDTVERDIVNRVDQVGVFAHALDCGIVADV